MSIPTEEIAAWLVSDYFDTRPRQFAAFVRSVRAVLAEALEPNLQNIDLSVDPDIAFAEALGDDFPPTLLLLAHDQLFTVRVIDATPVKVALTYLGELPGGRYSEEATVRDRVIARSIKYEHPRLKDANVSLAFEIDSREPKGRRFDEMLRPLLIKWSTITQVGG